MSQKTSQRGFSLIEVMIALGVLSVGVFGVAAVITAGMRSLNASPTDVVVTQKAAQAVEAVFSARDSHKLTWAQIRNVRGGSGTDNGIFADGPQELREAGPDGLVNTSDDSTTIESVRSPGIDQLLGTSDDRIDSLGAFRREIEIRDVPGENNQLRSIKVTITYSTGAAQRTYTLSSFISAYS